MNSRLLIALTVLVTALSGLPALAQDEGNAPPVVSSVAWSIQRNIGDSPAGPYLTAVPFNPDTDLARELDILIATFIVTDPDFTAEGDDQLYFRQRSVWLPVPGFPTPEGPPITEDDENFQPEEGEGIKPGSGTSVTVRFVFFVPTFQGKNQARLRGLVDYDVQYVVEFAFSNEQDPESQTQDEGDVIIGVSCFSDGVVTRECESIEVIESPNLAPPNPSPRADAGADQTVAVGTVVTLDGSRTFDGFNVGFDPLDPNVFEKDLITYSWEWISGPERVDPVYRDLVNKPWEAEVTLNTVGTYVYRLLADDNINSLPTEDNVTITVLSAIPPNRPPFARINAPAGSVVIDSIITLDGTSSSDPDGDPLTFRWRQTDELGGNLSEDDTRRLFQPLGGLDSPISVWQAVQPGTFYFRLLVSDGAELASKRVSVTVIESGVAGTQATNAFVQSARDSESGPTSIDDSAPSAPACGGGLAPLLALPLMLWLTRGRGR